MISSQIDSDCYSLLDIGSNLGTFTAKAATSGLWALGIEMSPKLIRQAQSTYGPLENCGFMCGRLDLEACRRIPRFDVILILSVHHHWHQAFGPEVAAEMLREVVKKSRHVVIFEGASRTARYLRDLPDFVDNDEESIIKYYSKYLQNTLGDITSDIRLLGKSPCVGEREPFRWMYRLVPDAG
jgi:SAM-dependent methyltransferase